jgi:serine/threonine protein kinase/dipeptidyl aminopeptidase/acylaminoacyl peptidase
MALASGTKLGPYEIQSLLGAGGMGEVYRALDSRLDREVAVKVLASHLSDSLELRTRFEREAKAISGLQHPHICVLYDVGRQDGVDFLVMEYLQGETLSARLERKPLTADETLRIAIEVADALDKAHRSGIVHRDLKPGNVMLTKSGAKLMDFGLAKLQTFATGSQSGTPAFSAVATMATMASPVTVAGTLVGTVQYMSPEQIQGKEADARSDIFAFGAMLYEMLTGKRPFEGKSQLSVASAVLEKEPEPISKILPLTPPSLEHVVQTCLAKDPDQRVQSAHDLKLQLQWIVGGGSQTGTPAIVTSQRRNRQKLLTLATVLGWLLAAVAMVTVVKYAYRLSSAQMLFRAQLEQPQSFNFTAVLEGAPVLSPDGQQVAFVASKDKKTNLLLVQRLSSAKVEPLSGTEGAMFPFWSPDGRYLGFFANGKLKKIEASGGPVEALCDAPEGRGGAWSKSGIILFAPNIAGPLLRVSEGGGTAEEATPGLKNDSQFTNRNPYLLPDGKHFLFVQRSTQEPLGTLYGASLNGGPPKKLLPFGSNVSYSDGYLFYMKDGTLTAQAFDADALRLHGKSVPIAESVEYYNPRNVGYFSISQGVLVYRQNILENREIVWLDATGKESEHWGDPAPYIGGTLSPASHAAVLYRQNADGHGNSLWLADTQRKTITRLTPDSDLAQAGIVSIDGKSMVTSATSGYHSVVVQRSLISSGKEEKLAELDAAIYLESQSMDGRYLFFSLQDPKTSFDVYVMDMAGDRKFKPVLNGPYHESDAKLSPDNKWLAFNSDENGSLELYVTPFPDSGPKWQVSTSGVTATDNNVSAADWSPDGKQLYYRQGDKIFTVKAGTNSSKPEFSAPKELLSIPQELDAIAFMAEGKRIMATRPVGQHSLAPMSVVLNWQRLMQ